MLNPADNSGKGLDLRNELLAVAGILVYFPANVLPVSYTTARPWVHVMPPALTLLCESAMLAFVVAAARRLWKTARTVVLDYAAAQVPLLVLASATALGLDSRFENSVAVARNLLLVLNLVLFIRVLVKLFRTVAPRTDRVGPHY